jgi:drug/metabolite transporter, DME family
MPAYIFIILAAILWGTTGTSQELAPDAASPLAIGTMRLFVGGTALFILAFSRGELRWHSDWLRTETIFAGLSAAFYQLTFFAGVSLTGVAVGTIITIGSAPIFTGILGYFFESEILQRRWWLATGLAILGGVLLAFAGDETMQVNPLGILLALSAGLSYGVFALSNKRLVTIFSPDAAMAVSFSLGALLLLPTLLFVNISWILSFEGGLVVLHLGLIATALAYMLFGRGLKTVAISTAGTLSLVEPLTAALLGVFLLGEQLNALGFIGVSSLFLGLLILVMKRQNRK